MFELFEMCTFQRFLQVLEILHLQFYISKRSKSSECQVVLTTSKYCGSSLKIEVVVVLILFVVLVFKLLSSLTALVRFDVINIFCNTEKYFRVIKNKSIKITSLRLNSASENIIAFIKNLNVFIQMQFTFSLIWNTHVFWIIIF